MEEKTPGHCLICQEITTLRHVFQCVGISSDVKGAEGNINYKLPQVQADRERNTVSMPIQGTNNL